MAKSEVVDPVTRTMILDAVKALEAKVDIQGVQMATLIDGQASLEQGQTALAVGIGELQADVDTLLSRGEGGGAGFMVVPPDGTDDAPAINQALATEGVNGAVYLLAGNYTVKTPVLVGDRQSLIGAGGAQTVITAAPGFTGQAVVRTPVGFTGTRVVLRDFAADAAGRAQNGVLVESNGTPPAYTPDPMPTITRVFVYRSTGDGFVLGGTYGGGCREFHVSDCRAQGVGGWGFNWSGSSDGFIWGCSVQGAKAGGYLVGGANAKVFGNKCYGTGQPGAPGPGFRVSSSRCTLVGNEAQDCYGNGFELTGGQCVASGNTADSTGVGTADPANSAGFLVTGGKAHVTGQAFMALGRGAHWIAAGAGMTHSLNLRGASRVYVRLTSGDVVDTYQAKVNGTVPGDCDVIVL